MSHTDSPILIIGAGGFAREVLWLLEDAGMAHLVAGFVSPGLEGSIHGYDTWSSDEEIMSSFPRNARFVAAIGNGSRRKEVSQKYLGCGWQPLTVVHPSATISRHATLGEGCIICAGARIGPDTRIGDGCVVNLNACVGHDSVLGDFVTLHPGSKVNGSCSIGSLTELGTLSAMLPGVAVGASSVIGMGAMVIRDLPDLVVAAGVPAKILRQL